MSAVGVARELQVDPVGRIGGLAGGAGLMIHENAQIVVGKVQERARQIVPARAPALGRHVVDARHRHAAALDADRDGLVFKEHHAVPADDLEELLALGTDVLVVARHAEDAVGSLEARERRKIGVALRDGRVALERTVGEVARDEHEIGPGGVDGLHHGLGPGGREEVRGVQIRDLRHLEAL